MNGIAFKLITRENVRIFVRQMTIICRAINKQSPSEQNSGGDLRYREKSKSSILEKSFGFIRVGTRLSGSYLNLQQ